MIGPRRSTLESDVMRGGEAVTFKEVLSQVLDWLQQDKRVSYRTLKRQFSLDDAYLEDLNLEIIEVHQVAVDQDGTMLVWTGGSTPVSVPAAPPASPQDREPLSYTPPHLAEKILTSGSALEGERKQVTVLFADLKGSMELLAERVDGGYRFTGRTSFGSLTPVWTSLGLHGMDTSDPHAPTIVHAFMPPDTKGYTIKETWDVLGMRATRSEDTLREGALVPDQSIARVVETGAAGIDLCVLAICAWAQPTFATIYYAIAQRAFD